MDKTGLPDPNLVTTTPTTLLTKIINNTTGDAGFGKSHLEFTYNGKQLTKAVRYTYQSDGSVSNAETTTFNYNSSGNLTGTVISNSNNAAYVGYVKTDITASGNGVSALKIYFANNVLSDDITFAYQNARVNSFTSTVNGLYTYSYNSSGNNTQFFTDHAITNNTFDTHKNLSSAIPYWVYFSFIMFSDYHIQGVPLNPGTNNVLSLSENGYNYSYTYQYNSYDYPSVSTSTVKASNGANLSFQYQYIQVN